MATSVADIVTTVSAMKTEILRLGTIITQLRSDVAIQPAPQAQIDALQSALTDLLNTLKSVS